MQMLTNGADSYIKRKARQQIPDNLIPLIELGMEYHSYICGGYARYISAPKSFDGEAVDPFTGAEGKDPIPAGDIDIFCSSGDAFLKLDVGISKMFPRAKVKASKFAYNYDTTKELGHPIQLIKARDNGVIHTYGKVYDLLDNFDFSVARAAIVSPTMTLVHPQFDKDEARRLLRVLVPMHNPFRIMLRAAKYAKKGYTLPPVEMVRLFVAWENYSDEYKKKLMGIFSQLNDAEGFQFGKAIPTMETMTNEQKEEMYELFWGDGMNWGNGSAK